MFVGTLVIRRLFGYKRWESVKAVLMGLGRLNIKNLSMLSKTKFYRRLFLAYDSSLRDVFYVFLLHNSDNDPMLKTVFGLHQLLLIMFGLHLKPMLSCSVISVCLSSLSVCLSICTLPTGKIIY